MSFNLWRRGHQLYFRIPVPRPLRKLFLTSTGKPKNQIVEPIGSDYEAAKVECARRVAQWTEAFARLKAGASMAEVEAGMAEARKAARYGEHLTKTRHQMRAAALASGELTLEQAKENLKTTAARVVRDATEFGFPVADIFPGAPVVELPAPVASPPVQSGGETVSQAAKAWFAEMQRDKSVAFRQTMPWRLG